MKRKKTISDSTDASQGDVDSSITLDARLRSLPCQIASTLVVMILMLSLFSTSSIALDSDLREQTNVAVSYQGASECFQESDATLYPSSEGWLLEVMLRILQPTQVTKDAFEATWNISGPEPVVLSTTPVLFQTPSLYFDVDHSFALAADSNQAAKESDFWAHKWYSGIMSSMLLTPSVLPNGTGIEVHCNCECGNAVKSCEPLNSGSPAANNIQDALECISKDHSAGNIMSGAIEVCGTPPTEFTTWVVVRGQPADSPLFDSEMLVSEIRSIAGSMVRRYSSPSILNESKVIILVLGRNNLLTTADLKKQSESLNHEVSDLAKKHRMYAYLVPMQGVSVDILAAQAQGEIERPSFVKMSLLLPKLLTKSQAKDSQLVIKHRSSGCKNVPITIPVHPVGAAPEQQTVFLDALQWFPQVILYFLVPLIVLSISLFTYRYDVLGTRTKLNKELDFPWLPKE